MLFCGFWDGYSVGNASVTRQSSVAYSGSNAIAQVSNAADSYFGHYRGSSTAALAPATQSDGFTVSAYAKADSENTFAYLSLYGLDANYETIGEEGDVHQNIVVGDLIKKIQRRKTSPKIGYWHIWDNYDNIPDITERTNHEYI